MLSMKSSQFSNTNLYIIKRVMEDLLKEIEQLSDYTDMKKWLELKKRVEILNIYDENNKPIFEAARCKGLI